MRKHLVAMLLTAGILFMNLLPVYAAAGFDSSVLKNAPDITVSAYEDGGNAYKISSLQGVNFSSSKDLVLYFEVSVLEDNTAEGYMLSFQYASYDLVLDIQEIKVEIDNKVYTFSNPASRMNLLASPSDRAIIQEAATIVIGQDSLSFMQDLMEHRNETVKVSLTGTEQELYFELPQNVKDSAIHMYNLYVQAGGTRAENLAYLKGTEVKTGKSAE